jgi:hypothetical protein
MNTQGKGDDALQQDEADALTDLRPVVVPLRVGPRRLITWALLMPTIFLDSFRTTSYVPRAFRPFLQRVICSGLISFR